MLKFWKKSGHVDKNNYQQSTTTTTNQSTNEINDISHENPTNNKTTPLGSFDDEGLYDIDEFETIKEHSRLSRTLQQVLIDKNSLNYFLQFMESRNASLYVYCWLDIEEFRTEQNKSVNVPISNNNNSKIVDHDSLSVSTDCDSLITDLSSLNDYSVTKNLQNDTINNNNNNCCDMSDTSLNLIINQKALIIYRKYLIKQENFNELTNDEIQLKINCPELIRNELIENLLNNSLNLNSFDNFQNYLFDLIETNYFELFLNSNQFCKYQIDILTSGNIALDDILYNETALFYFMEYLDEYYNDNNKRCLLECWIACTNFQKQLKQFYDPIQAQNDAIVLYDKYFSLQAYCPLGFNNKIRLIIEQNICGNDGGLLILDCFHLPIKLIEQILERTYLKPFLTSQLFYKYLSELINTIQTNNYQSAIQNYEQKKLASITSDDSNSERSSSFSTFLALDLSDNREKTVNKRNNNDMSIDTRELCDPDSLWKRKRKHLLSCGHVTELGKFVTDFEPEPDRKEFNLKNVMKKLVTTTQDDNDKKKEEMAWQVAEMIVKDITNITLRHQDQSSCHL